MDSFNPIKNLKVAVKGAGDLASGVAWVLFQANIRKLFMLEIEKPLAVRRAVSFCEAMVQGRIVVEGVTAVKAADSQEIPEVWEKERIPVLSDPSWTSIGRMKPDVVVDAIMAKRNTGTRADEAALVIGLGPGFTAGVDCHMVVETRRGHNLARVILSGAAEPDTGVPGVIGGYSSERLLRSPRGGVFTAVRHLGELVRKGDVVGAVDGEDVIASIDGKIRGLIMSGISVPKGTKIGDVDPRGADVSHETISDKSRAIGRAVLEAVMRVYNK